ncbi:MAG: hypothetical protein CM15mP119_3690 [Alphaproteobacteria bacterium]|nr:MAG: hypothetical protein CM15mP119_3690 [Alphaproteobacteria bacterium]
MSEKTEQMNKAEPPKKGRWLIEYGPLILFFVVNYVAGILFGFSSSCFSNNHRLGYLGPFIVISR